jgi:superfamily II DNA helicase RecQ
MNKQNIFVIMPTGGGKSPVINPVLIQEGTAIVSPLIALMKTKSMPSGVSERGIALMF